MWAIIINFYNRPLWLINEVISFWRSKVIVASSHNWEGRLSTLRFLGLFVFGVFSKLLQRWTDSISEVKGRWNLMCKIYYICKGIFIKFGKETNLRLKGELTKVCATSRFIDVVLHKHHKGTTSILAHHLWLKDKIIWLFIVVLIQKSQKSWGARR